MRKHLPTTIPGSGQALCFQKSTRMFWKVLERNGQRSPSYAKAGRAARLEGGRDKARVTPSLRFCLPTTKVALVQGSIPDRKRPGSGPHSATHSVMRRVPLPLGPKDGQHLPTPHPPPPHLVPYLGGTNVETRSKGWTSISQPETRVEMPPPLTEVLWSFLLLSPTRTVALAFRGIHKGHCRPCLKSPPEAPEI